MKLNVFRVMLILMVLISFIAFSGCKKKSSTEDLTDDDINEFDDDFSDDEQIVYPDDDCRVDDDPDDDPVDPDIPEEAFPAMRDGKEYVRLQSMIASLAGMPTYKVNLPEAMVAGYEHTPTILKSVLPKSFSGGIAFQKINNGMLSPFTPFNPDDVDDIMSAQFDVFRGETSIAEGVQSLSGLIDFIQVYLEKNPIPQGTAVSIEVQPFGYTFYHSYGEETRTAEIDMGRFSWYFDQETGSFTIYWRLKDPAMQVINYNNSDPAHKHPEEYHFYTIFGLPIEGEGDETKYEYTVYQSMPVSSETDYNGKGIDHAFTQITFNEVTGELSTYYRGLHLPWTIGRDDDLYLISSYSYRYYWPVPDSENGEIYLYSESSNVGIVAEIDPFSGFITRWVDYDFSTNEDNGDLQHVNPEKRFAAWGNDSEGALVSENGDFFTADYYNQDGVLIYRMQGLVDPDVDGPYHRYFGGYNLKETFDTEAPDFVWAVHDGPDFYITGKNDGTPPQFDAGAWSQLASMYASFFWRSDDEWNTGDWHYQYENTDDCNGTNCLRYKKTYAVPKPETFFGKTFRVYGSWPMKYLETEDEENSITFNDQGINILYFLEKGSDSISLPTRIAKMGKYMDDNTWNGDVPVPFFEAASIHPDLKMKNGLGDIVNSITPKIEELANKKYLTLLDHPGHRIDSDEFNALLAYGSEGIWIRSDSGLRDDHAEVLLVDNSDRPSRFEYRLYDISDTESPEMIAALSGTVMVDRLPMVDVEESNSAGKLIYFDPPRHRFFFKYDLSYSSEKGEWFDSDSEDGNEITGKYFPDMAGSLNYWFVAGVYLDDLDLNMIITGPPEVEPLHYVFDMAEIDIYEKNEEKEEETLILHNSFQSVVSIYWSHAATPNRYIETVFHSTVWQETHYDVYNRGVTTVRAFRGTHNIDSAGNGTLTVTGIYDKDSNSWVMTEENDAQFNELLEEDEYLDGKSSWDVKVTRNYDRMTLDFDLHGENTTYNYLRQNNNIPIKACMLRRCVPLAASHCPRAIEGETETTLAGRGMSYPVDQWNNDHPQIGLCISNCQAHNFCNNSQRTAYFIDCRNQSLPLGGGCSITGTPIDPESCSKVKTFPQMRAEYRSCLDKCRLDLEVTFPPITPLQSTVEQCIAIYGSY